MEIFIWQELTQTQKNACLTRPLQRDDATIAQQVQYIIDEVKQSGDEALKKFTQQFDKVTLTDLIVNTASQKPELSLAVKQAMDIAYHNIYKFHAALTLPKVQVETSPGIFCEKITRPIHSVGLYIPGGTAPLISTVMMLGIPAQIAQCPQVVLCTPPNAQGNIDPHIIYAAQLCGIKTLYKIGGAQAIAAMAYGTETVARVDKIFGPGNSWVTCAKQIVASQGSCIDMPAGPSEVMVIADDRANPSFVAADLLSQAEHGKDSQVILVCLSKAMAEKVQTALAQLLPQLPRKAIAEASLSHSSMIVVDDLAEAVLISNQYAPEHLIIQTQNPRDLLPHIKCAGSIFLGQYAPESVGDYASGTNHVLPTYGYARSHSGLGLQDFMLHISVQELTQAGLQTIGPSVETLAQIEGLHAHALAVSIRLQDKKHD